ncbi:hypothetical protein J6O86_00510, partial [bacterium]|nr:hypothetical protein [bacterium]
INKEMLKRVQHDKQFRIICKLGFQPNNIKCWGKTPTYLFTQFYPFCHSEFISESPTEHSF